MFSPDKKTKSYYQGETTMIDLNLITKNPQETFEKLLQRGYQPPYGFLELLQEHKKTKMELEAVYAMRNTNKDPAIGRDLKIQAGILEKKLVELDQQKQDFILLIPNVLHETVPLGETELDNPVVKMVGDTIAKPLHHLDVAEKLGFNQQAGVHLAKARFNVFPPALQKMHRGILNDALVHYEQCGYQEYYVPQIVNKTTITGTGQYPKFNEELFHVDEFFLIPTGEVPLTNLYADTFLENDFETIKLMTQTACFRKEVGAGGKDTRGFLRQHQFEKLELVRICQPEVGLQNLEEMMEEIEDYVKTLNIPYRIIELCAKDIGFAGHKAYDFELWFSGQNAYREIASVTWCHDFQARRMKTKTKNKKLVHTLNATGVAAGRVMAAKLEWEQ